MSTDSSRQPPEVSIKVEDRVLLASGIIHLNGITSLVATISNLRFIFTFKTDDGESRYSGALKEDGLYIDLFNHKNTLGEGMMKPLEVANIEGQALSVTYYVNTINADTNTRRFEYAFYLGPKI